MLSLMLHGKFDRAGVFDCDGHEPAEAISIVTRIPLEVVATGLPRIFRTGTWVHRDGKIVWPKYVHGQNCKRSDRLRQAESRDRRRMEALGMLPLFGDEPTSESAEGNLEENPESAGASNGASQPVTESHPSLAEPSLAEPSVLVATTSPPAMPAPTKPTRASSGKSGSNGGTRAKSSSSRPSKRVPSDWKHKPDHEQIAAERGVNLEFELSKFRDYQFKIAHVDWDAAARNWLRNARPEQRNGGGQRRPQPRQHSGEDVLGGVKIR